MVDNIELKDIGVATAGTPASQGGYGSELKQVASSIDSFFYSRRGDRIDKTPLAQLNKDLTLLASGLAQGTTDQKRAALMVNSIVNDFATRHPELTQDAVAMKDSALGDRGTIGSVTQLQQAKQEGQVEATKERYKLAASMQSPMIGGITASPEQLEQTLFNVTASASRLASAELQTKTSRAIIEQDTSKREEGELLRFNTHASDHTTLLLAGINQKVNLYLDQRSPDVTKQDPEQEAFAIEGILKQGEDAKAQLRSSYPIAFANGKLEGAVKLIDETVKGAISVLRDPTKTSTEMFSQQQQVLEAIGASRVLEVNGAPELVYMLRTIMQFSPFVTSASFNKLGSSAIQPVLDALNSRLGQHKKEPQVPQSNPPPLTKEQASAISSVVNPQVMKENPDAAARSAETVLDSLKNEDTDPKVYDEVLDMLAKDSSVSKKLMDENSGIKQSTKDHMEFYLRSLMEKMGKDLNSSLNTTIDVPDLDSSSVNGLLNRLGVEIGISDNNVPKAAQVVNLNIDYGTGRLTFTPKLEVAKYKAVQDIANTLNRKYSDRFSKFVRIHSAMSGEDYRTSTEKVINNDSSFKFLTQPLTQEFGISKENKPVTAFEQLQSKIDDLNNTLKEQAINLSILKEEQRAKQLESEGKTAEATKVLERVKVLLEDKKVVTNTILKKQDLQPNDIVQMPGTKELQIVDEDTGELRPLTPEEQSAYDSSR